MASCGNKFRLINLSLIKIKCLIIANICMLTCFATSQMQRRQCVNGEHQSMMVVVHRIAGQVAGIAERHETLLLHLVFALWRIADDMCHHKVIMVECRRQGIFGVSKYTLELQDFNIPFNEIWNYVFL